MTTIDAALFRRWMRHRDAEAFACIVERHSSMVLGASRRITGNASDAEEVAQDCFLKLSRHDKFLRCPAAWLHTAAVRGALDRIRAERRRLERETAYADSRAAVSQADAENEQALAVLDELLAGLDERYRAPIVLRFLEAKTQAEVAQHLGVSRSRVQKLLDKGLQKLRESFRQRGITLSKDALAGILGAQLPVVTAPTGLVTAINRQVLATMCSRPPVSAFGYAWQSILGMGWTVALVCGAILGISALGVAGTHYAKAYFGTNSAQPAVKESVKPDALSAQGENGKAKTPYPKAPTRSTAKAGTGQAGVTPAADGATKSATAMVNADAKSGGEGKGAAWLSGIVTDDAKQPLAKVRITVRQEEEKVTFTANDGTFRFDRLDADDVRIWAEAPGYVTDASEEKLEPGENTVTLTLQPAEDYIRGIVIEESEKPIADAGIYAGTMQNGTQEPDGSYRSYSNIFSPETIRTRTDQLGRFEMAVPEKASYSLVVNHPDYPLTEFTDIESGGEEVTLKVLTAGAVSGRVTHSDGSPYEGALVTVAAAGPRAERAILLTTPVQEAQETSVADANGKYTLRNLSSQMIYDIGVYPAGQEIVGKEWFTIGRRPLALRQHIKPEAGRTVENVDFVVAENTSCTISGRVLDETTRQPVTQFGIGAHVSAPYRFLGSSITDVDGSYKIEFTLDKKAPVMVIGTYTGTGIATNVDIKRADTGELLEEVEFNPGDAVSIDFLVAMPFQIPVLVVDAAGRPVEGVAVAVGTIRENGMRIGGLRFIKTDAEGRCVCGVEPEGQHYVWVQEKDNDILGETAVAMSPPISAAQGNPAQEVVLVYQAKSGIEGTFVLPDGMPIQMGTVTLTATSSSGRTESAIFNSRETGIFYAVNALPPDSYTALEFNILTKAGTYRANMADVTLQVGTIAQLGPIAVTQ